MKSNTLFPSFLFIALVAPISFFGCSQEAEQPAVEEKAEDAVKEAPPAIAADAIKAAAKKVALVPSPVETQRALKAAGIETTLASLLKPHPFNLKSKELDFVAVRTGVILADLLLTLKSAEKNALINQMNLVQIGMNQLGAGEDIDRTMQDILDRTRADSVSRDDLIQEFDELAGAVIPELDFNGVSRITPLIQAGSWLEGANLVAQAAKGTENPDAVNALLKQPAVVDYFLEYTQTEGQDKAPAAVTETLQSSLNTLKALADKTEPLTAEDLDSVISVTNDVLSLL